jgi:hypothetical protein
MAMDNFLKVGSTVINLTLVTDMHMEDDGSVSIYLAAPSTSKPGCRVLSLSGAEASKLRDLITLKVTDIQVPRV